MARGSAAAKRAFDIVVGGLLLLLVLPVIVASALTVAVLLRTWPFFAQERIGRNGRPFRFVKIRTLPRTAPAYADKYTIAEVRIPRFSALLRARHIDELPQLLLVVLGRMSLVGPRPEMPQLHAAMSPAFARLRTMVRPGCTGLWQISEQIRGMIHEAPEYDVHYVRHASLRLDLWIVARTLGIVFLGRPAIAGVDEVRGAPPAAEVAGPATSTTTTSSTTTSSTTTATTVAAAQAD